MGPRMRACTVRSCAHTQPARLLPVAMQQPGGLDQGACLLPRQTLQRARLCHELPGEGQGQGQAVLRVHDAVDELVGVQLHLLANQRGGPRPPSPRPAHLQGRTRNGRCC